MYQLQKKASESFAVGIILAIVGGYLDLYTYVSRGGVFANAQTGNMLFLVINGANGDFEKVFMYALPIFAFTLGIIVTEYMKAHYRRTYHLHWRQRIIALEVVVLFIIAFVPSGRYDDFVNIAVAFVCSMQVESFRAFEGNGFATTMCTGNLRSASELLYYSNANKDTSARRRSLKYFGIILFFMFGAVAGMKLTERYQEKAVLVACVLLLIVFAILFIPMKDDPMKEEVLKHKRKAGGKARKKRRRKQ